MPQTGHDIQNVIKPVESLVRQDVKQDNRVPVLVFPTKPLSECKYERNANSAPKYGMYVEAECFAENEKMSIKVLIDSGATMSLLDMSVFDKLPDYYKSQLIETEKTVKFADGSLQKSCGTFKMALKLGNEMVELEFLLGHFSDQAILGMPDLQKLKLSIDFENVVVTKGDLWLPDWKEDNC